VIFNRAKFVFTIGLIPLILSIGIVPALSFADNKDSETECREGLALVFRTTAHDYVCLSHDSAKNWESLGLGEIVVDIAENEPEAQMIEAEIPEPVFAESNGQPNIIIIMPDDVGWYNIGAYHEGIMAGITPNIDSIAENGMRFTDYYADPSCTAGRASFITGELPIRMV